MRDHLLRTDKTGDSVAPYLLREPGRHCDGGGLYLEVAAPGQASWMYRYKNGWRSIGSANGFSIREAREIAAKLWQAARRGEDPFALLATLRAPKAAEKPLGKLFSEALAEYLAAKSPHWSPSNRARELRRYEFLFEQIPDFTALRLPKIDQAAKNKALAKWNEQPKARRDVGFYIEAILRYAETGKLRIVGGQPKAKHHEAMPYADVPAFFTKLSGLGTINARALQFLIMTGARTDEVIGRKEKRVWRKARPTWREIEEANGEATWVIPGREIGDGGDYRGMKGRKDHSVPLSPAALALLGERQADDVPLFVTTGGQNALLNTLRETNGEDATVHGFRSSISDWGIEHGYSRDLIDMCIAHGEDRDGWTDPKTRRAYQRSELLKLRREIMLGWSDYVTA
ncbi:tyrosine-type recombinase/integrase [Bradyrhizobium sp. USDA 4508]